MSKSNNNAITYSFLLTNTGGVTFTGGFSFDNERLSYQLKPTSRLGFIGCWLVMVPVESRLTQGSNTSNNIPKQIFIYRDSLSKQDFSRLARVLKQLGEVS